MSSRAPCPCVPLRLNPVPNRERPVRFVWGAAAMLLCALIQPGPSRAQSLESPFSGTVEANLMTVDGAVYPNAEQRRAGLTTLPVRLTTATDLDRPEDSLGSIYRFESGPIGIRFRSLKAIVLRGVSKEWIGSTASRLEWYRLGSVGHAPPPPPGWARRSGGHAAWSKAEAVAPLATTAYLYRSQMCWTDRDAASESAKGDFLFRARIDLPQFGKLEQATLRIAGDCEILSIRLNDHPVLRLGRAVAIAEFEVTALTQGGPNVLGLIVRNVGETRPSIGFHLELTYSDLNVDRQRHVESKALLITRSGTRLYGDIQRLDADRLSIASLYGAYELPWDEVSALLMPNGWTEPEAEAPWPIQIIRRIPGLRPVPPPPPPVFGFELMGDKDNGQTRILLSDNRVVTANPIGIDAENLIVERSEGDVRSIALSRVLAIYPQSSGETVLRRLKGETVLLQCRIRTSLGESIGGVLRQLNSKKVILEADAASDASPFLEFHPGNIDWIWFPEHGITRARESVRRAVGAPGGGRLAVLNVPGRSKRGEARFEELSAEVQQAAFLVGLESELPSVETLAHAGRLNPLAFPVAVAIDPQGRYLDTLEHEGDAREALSSYVAEGGTLIVYAERGALSTSVLRLGSRFTERKNESALAKAIGIRTLEPGTADRGAIAFTRPPAKPRGLQFTRTRNVPTGLEGLPSFVFMPSLGSAPFMPVLSDAPGTRVLYELTTESGDSFGPAMTLIPHGKGRIIVIDHLLWKSSVEGSPFVRVILPLVIAWSAMGS